MPGRSMTLSAPRQRSVRAAGPVGNAGGGSRHRPPQGPPGSGDEWPVFWRCFTASDRTTRGILSDLVADLSDAGLAGGDLSNAELVLAYQGAVAPEVFRALAAR